MPSGRAAIATAFAHLPADSEVWITSSFGTPLRRLTPCVAEAVSWSARPAESPSERTRGVLLVHEWGFPHPASKLIEREAQRRNWTLVHDCAHAFNHGVELAKAGATVTFSLPKLFPVPMGGLLASRSMGLSESGPGATASGSFHEDWGSRLLEEAKERSAQQIRNWHRLDRLIGGFGLGGLDRLPPGVVPQVYRVRLAKQFAASQCFASHSIETAPPFYTGWLAIPCHAELPASYWDDVRAAVATAALSS